MMGRCHGEPHFPCVSELHGWRGKVWKASVPFFLFQTRWKNNRASLSDGGDVWNLRGEGNCRNLLLLGHPAGLAQTLYFKKLFVIFT